MKLIIIGAFMISVLSCTSNKIPHQTIQSDFEKISWLIGTWKQKTKRGTIYETWHQQYDYLLEGRSYSISEKDTSVFETIQILQKDGSLYYIPRVLGQNNTEAIEFKCSQLTNNQMRFENLDHDFPQIITYRKVGNDSLLASISGIRDNESREILFPMTRM